MAGELTNGLPLISAPLLNTVTQTVPNGLYSNLSAQALIPVDTQLASGAQPQTVAATAFQVAALAGALINNTVTSTAGAATKNTTTGLIYTEALTTASGADYVMTLTNSLLTTTTPAPQIGVRSGTNTAGAFAVKSVVNGSGSSVITITNVGTAAFNGTLNIMFHM